MSGVTPLVDTLLATRLGQRVDLVPLKGQVEIAGPGAPTGVEKVVNDVRQPSRDALQRQLGAVALPDHGDAGLAPSSGKPGTPVALSSAARTISAILNLRAGDASAVRGVAPLWPDHQSPVGSLLAANLARAVAGSGLFYESHLQQYLGGMRTLAQVAQEPQAQLSAAGKMNPGDPALRLANPVAASGGGARLVDSSLPVPASTASLSAVAAAALIADEASPVPTPAGRAAANPGSGTPQAEGEGATAPSAGAVLRPDAVVDLATAYGRTVAADNRHVPFHDIAGQEAGIESPRADVPDVLRASKPVAAVHPEAMALVRQQLDLLAMPVFRWTGESWPGVSMDWEISQEREEQAGREGGQDRRADGGTETAPSAWTTRMTLELPRLGTVDVCLGLAGATLQLRLNASQDSTVAELSQARAGLPQLFGAVGLELADVQIGRTERRAGAAEPAGFTGNGHAA